MVAEIELEVGGGAASDEFTIRVVRAASGGEPSVTTRLDVDGLLRDRDALEAVVLASGVSGRGLSHAESQLRRVGTQLFDALFSGPVMGTYRASTGVALQQGQPLRVVLRLNAPQLAALPWEAMFDSETQTYVCRREPLVRHVPAPYTPAPLEVTPPLRLLGLVASPRGLPALDVSAEQQRLSEALAVPIAEGLIEVHWIPQATWEAVHEELLSGAWHVVHFIGHGDYDAACDQGRIVLEGSDGRANPVEATRLADLLNEAHPIPRLVVLNSCSSGEEASRDLLSGTAATLVHGGIGAVAAMQFAVSDPAAIAFSRGFYTAIAHGHSVDDAIRSGRIAILGAPHTLEWVTPVLYVRGENTQLFSLPATPRRVIQLGQPPRKAGAGRLRLRWPSGYGSRSVLAGFLTALLIGTAAVAAQVLVGGHDGPPMPRSLAVTHEADNLGDPCPDSYGWTQHGWVFPQTIDSLPWVKQVTDPVWVERFGGVPVSGDYYNFTLAAASPSAAVFLDRPVIEVIGQRLPPLTGVHPQLWGCDQKIRVESFGIQLDLDEGRVEVRDQDGRMQSWSTSHRIDSEHPEFWRVRVHTESCLCFWRLKIPWHSGDRSGFEILDDNGKPFRVTALTPSVTKIDNDDGRLPAWRVMPGS
jgi:hypothetical protein